MAPHGLRSRRRWALVAAAATTALAGLLQRAASASFALPGRRQALIGASAAWAGSQPALAYENEATRVGIYTEKAKKLNEAVDWFLFELLPLLYPAEMVSREDCEVMGDACPDQAGLVKVNEWYEVVGAVRGGGGVVLSKLDRDVFNPMKIIATGDIFDPDTADDLRTLELQLEKVSAELRKAAREGDITVTREKFDQTRVIINSFFEKCNNAMGFPKDNEFYVTAIPLINKSEDLLKDRYWRRRADKYLIKKKVDAISKGSKTARFYAKSIFGEDAESWDYRGDRASEYWK